MKNKNFKRDLSQKTEVLKKNELALQNANQKQLETYFKKVSELQRTGEAFPVDLDEVWPLVYAQKVKALEVLEREFIDGVEFNLSQKGKVLKFKDLQNGVKITAKISVATMEYLIVRKSKPVFEVYRRVFHSVNTPVNGVMPIFQNGILGYPRKEILIASNRSYKSGSVWKLKKRYPDECFLIGNTACVSYRLAVLLQREGEYRRSQLDLFNDQKRLS